MKLQKTVSDEQALRAIWDEADIMVNQYVGFSKNGQNAYTAAIQIWKTNVGMILETTVTISGNSAYEAMDKVIAKIKTLHNIELENPKPAEPKFDLVTFLRNFDWTTGRAR